MKRQSPKVPRLKAIYSSVALWCALLGIVTKQIHLHFLCIIDVIIIKSEVER